MICVIQRVSEAGVRVDGREIARIGQGLLVLAAIHKTDASEDVIWTARKLVGLRVFAEGDHNFERDLMQVGGSILLVSNFTVAADTAKGRRPSLDAAADPATAAVRFEELVGAVRALEASVQTGQFGAEMKVWSINDGPVTILLDSRGRQPMK